MKVNPEQLRDDGYIILREVIPQEQLDDVRASFEVLVERQKEIWAQEGNRSVWETGVRNRGWDTSRTSLTKKPLTPLRHGCTTIPWGLLVSC